MTEKKQLFYWFVESQNDPANDPVVLWLNGGPGCSSFDGFVYEHGPFHFEDGPMGAEQVLTLNHESWNKVANMIYLDSPAGVGLSYSTNPNVDYITNDKITANDSRNFLLKFFTAYPEFSKNDFYIAGESYAGIYVPTLAQQVYIGNNNPKQYINLKGYLVGNGVTDEVIDGNALVPFVYGHALIPDSLYNQLVTTCNGIYWNATGACNQLMMQAYNLVADLNVYNIYESCAGLGPKVDIQKMLNLWYRIRQPVRDSSVGGSVPCIDSSRAHKWINQDSVRTSIHAISVQQKEWFICSDNISYTSVYSTVIPIHQQLIQAGIRALVYSGDTDMCVPFTGSEAWTDSLDMQIKQDWRPWKVNYQVAGYVKTYENPGSPLQHLTFATIKGSGHTVPQYKPAQAFHFFKNFLQNQPF